MRNRCDTCRWWGGERTHDDDAPYGRCRRHAPVHVRERMVRQRHPEAAHRGPLVTIDQARWPWTAFDDWCGDFLLARDDFPEIAERGQ